MRRAVLTILLLLAGTVAAAQVGDRAAFQDARREERLAAARSAAFERRARAAETEALRTQARSAALVARIEAAEAAITAGEARVRIIEAERARQRARIAERQAPLVRLTAALQTAARRPPALALAQRGSIAETVHVRALLASTLPQVRARTATLRAEAARAERLRDEARLALRALSRSRAALADERRALAGLEHEQRRRSASLAELAVAEGTRALAFSEAARDLTERAEQSGYQAQVRGRLAALPAPPPRPGRPAAQLPTAAYRMPVEGRLIEGVGELSDAGVHARGLTLVAAPGAAVAAPRAAVVRFARGFRDYGGVVILDHGRGWTTTLTGLGSVAVSAGTKVAAGDALGTAPARGGEIGVELRRGGRPAAITSLIE